MRPGVPSSAGTSNVSTAMMNDRNSDARMPGSISGSVTRRMMCAREAPLTAAASSSTGSAARIAGATSRKIAGSRVIDWMRIMLGIV